MYIRKYLNEYGSFDINTSLGSESNWPKLRERWYENGKARCGLGNAPARRRQAHALRWGNSHLWRLVGGGNLPRRYFIVVIRTAELISPAIVIWKYASPHVLQCLHIIIIRTRGKKIYSFNGLKIIIISNNETFLLFQTFFPFCGQIEKCI